jgi:hypothetical protein
LFTYGVLWWLCGLCPAVRAAKRFGRSAAAFLALAKDVGDIFETNKRTAVAVAEGIWEKAADASLKESTLTDCGQDLVAKKMAAEELVAKAKAAAQAAAGKAGQKGSRGQKGAAGVAVAPQVLVQQPMQHLLGQQLMGQQLLGQQQQQRPQRVAGPGDKCNYCQQAGHWARECYLNPKAEPRFQQMRQQREGQQGALLALPAPGH